MPTAPSASGRMLAGFIMIVCGPCCVLIMNGRGRSARSASVQVARQQRKDDEAGDGADQRLRAQRPQEHRFVAELLEPEPVGVELRRRRDARDQQEQRDHRIGNFSS